MVVANCIASLICLWNCLLGLGCPSVRMLSTCRCRSWVTIGHGQFCRNCKQIGVFNNWVCTGDISKTGRPINLIVVPMESSRPVDVPVGTFNQIRPIGHGLISRNWPNIGFFNIWVCTGDISKTGSPINLILVQMESSRPLDVPFGTFNQIRPIGHGQICQNCQTIGFFFKQLSLYGRYLEHGKAYTFDFVTNGKLPICRCTFWYF